MTFGARRWAYDACMRFDRATLDAAIAASGGAAQPTYQRDALLARPHALDWYKTLQASAGPLALPCLKFFVLGCHARHRRCHFGA
jgi:hypothetical protein